MPLDSLIITEGEIPEREKYLGKEGEVLARKEQGMNHLRNIEGILGIDLIGEITGKEITKIVGIIKTQEIIKILETIKTTETTKTLETPTTTETTEKVNLAKPNPVETRAKLKNTREKKKDTLKKKEIDTGKKPGGERGRREARRKETAGA